MPQNQTQPNQNLLSLQSTKESFLLNSFEKKKF